MGEAVEVFVANGFSNLYEKTDHKTLIINDNHHHKDSCWYEEVIDEDLKWSFALNRFVHTFIYEFTKPISNACPYFIRFPLFLFFSCLSLWLMILKFFLSFYDVHVLFHPVFCTKEPASTRTLLS